MIFRRVLWLLSLWLVTGCNAPQKINAPVASNFQSPKDDLGREITLEAPAKRVIVIGPGAVETMFALGAQKMMVGRDNYADFPPIVKKIAIAGDYKGPSVEKSVALRPDLVIVQGETWDKARVEQWQQQIGAPVAALVANDISGVQNGIKKIGGWLGQAKKAREVASSVRPQAFYGRNSAFIEIGRSPLWTAGQKTLVNDVLFAGGWTNIAKVNGYQAYGMESLLANQPDAYIVPSTATQSAVLRELRAHAVLSKLECVRKGQVVVIHPDHILRPGPRLALGMISLGRATSRLADVKAGKTRF